ncbi:aromatic amino acid transaminase [Rhizoctonia solani 123E]|uniref:Aromatic amino acid transaminase n=1 Tax=Rhizoctonia solani 123E TaxID=1423351 RepID=A0A074S6B5_9AGAM|nr:aromatic amino acid transaminase [Rhizoctonia solani 123E]
MPPAATNSTAEDAPEISQLKLSPEATKPANHNDYSRFLARRTGLRTIDGIRGLLPLEKTPGLISLLAGKPNPSTFPIEEITITLRAPNAPQPYSSSGGEPVRETLKIDGDLVATALQYSFTDGVPDFRAILADFQLKEHGVTIDDVNLQLTVGSGSQDLMYKIFTCLLDPGDAVLVEAPVYAGVLPILQTLEPDMIEVDTDPEGISINHLREILSNWPKDKPKPKALYTVPYGCNPTGATTPLERRVEVLKLAEEHDFLIIEDDPYYYLYFGSAERPPSYITLENSAQNIGQRRVLRLDSFSKVLSSGMRIGFATGPPHLIRVMNAHSSAANLQANSTTQVIALAMLRHWGYDGFRAHIANISDFYRAKRDAFEAAMYKHFKPEGGKPLAEWTRPEAGLFFWFKLNISNEDSFQLISTKAIEGGVLAVPGKIFFPSGRKTAYVRTAFSVMDIELADEGLRRLAKVVKDVIEGA